LGIAALALVLILAFSNLLLWQQLNRLQSRLPTNKLTLVTLLGTDAAPEASGLRIISADGRNGTLIVDRLAALDDAHQYQLWLIRDGKRTNGGVFSVSQTGFGTMKITAPDSLANYPAFGITIEPYGGSPGPTGEKVLGGEF
jgi:anti-sigma-K factor RskA